MDMLYRDLGLNNHRKRGWLSELVSPYLPADHAGLLDEWKAKSLNLYIRTARRIQDFIP